MRIFKTGMHALLYATILFVALTIACTADRGSWTPPLEQTSSRVLEEEAARALRQVRRAKETMATSPNEAAEAVSEAEKSLIHLSAYYLPLVEARARAYNAYSYLQTGQDDRALAELALTEKALVSIADGEVAQAENLMREPAAKLAEARIAITSGSADASKSVEELASLLNHEILKGAIELGGE